ncbi:UbiA prenyltransferase family protein [Aspergillus ustus]|uniref:UbiA prenyltransferase family protein n=1 Tax=Aspergillus ustus TaxID=40382 RepID=A0A0C1BWK6_ASPUT|nr:UbiA prenyltransferase family protein [Aspergillus ustus]
MTTTMTMANANAKTFNNSLPDAAAPQKHSRAQLAKDLLILSRFNRYNPFLATFSGVWATLLAGASQCDGNNNNNNDPRSTTTTTTHVFQQALLVFISGYLFCGAGMVWNDWVDVKIDQQVARTNKRPLAAGRVTSLQALIWMMAQYAASWVIMVYTLENKNVLEAMIPVTISTILYPYGKRSFFKAIYFYPQYFLGFTLGWPSVIGWLAIKGHTQSLQANIAESSALAVTVFAWTLYLNTAYSYQDIEGDRKARVNSIYFLAGPAYIHYFVGFLAGLVVFAIAVQLMGSQGQGGSQWLWGSWFCVWGWSFAGQLLRFSSGDPASGGGLHKENFALGVWTVVACAVELVLKCGGSKCQA